MTIVEFKRITRDGESVPCSFTADSIVTIEKSLRDSTTTIVRTTRGTIAVANSYDDAVAIWRRAIGG